MVNKQMVPGAGTEEGMMIREYEVHGLGNMVTVGDHLTALSTEAEKVRRLREALEALRVAVFGNVGEGDEPNVYDDYEKLCILSKQARTALEQARREG